MSKDRKRTRKIRNIIIISISIIAVIGVCMKIGLLEKVTTKTNPKLNEKLASKPSAIFDQAGTNPNGLHIGDFVNYDAGTWTQEEINAIKTGAKSSLVTANGTAELPTRYFQFGGFIAGGSKNERAEVVIGYTKNGVRYGGFVKDASTGKAISGWRVFDVTGDTVTLISAASPENYKHTNSATDYGIYSEYILSGNESYNYVSSKYQRRDWSNYINTKQKAKSAKPLKKHILEKWYEKYTNTENANIESDYYSSSSYMLPPNKTFQKIYTDPSYYRYQNMIENNSYNWLADRKSDKEMFSLYPDDRAVGTNDVRDDVAYTLRILVTLSSDISLEQTGEKITVTGGNTTAYGGDQTYNVWEIKEAEPEPEKTGKPSEIFDKEQINEKSLHIGDFVNYDAGTWTQEEINAIQTGAKSSLVTANGSTRLPSQRFQFGGFTAGSSRNGSATPYDAERNYLKDAETGKILTGWRVFDIEGDTVTLISAGNPEDFYYGYWSALESEYVLTGDVVLSNTNYEKDYQKRNWSDYINISQKAQSATVLYKDRLSEWYSKYNIVSINEPYLKYENIIDNNSDYWTCKGYADNRDLATIGVQVGNYKALGLRVLVTLSPDIILKRTGIKTIFEKDATTYGDDLTYNVWNIVTDTTPPTGGKISASALYTNQPNVTLYVDGVTDNESGVNCVHINGWYGFSWVAQHKTIVGTYDAANNRYYTTYTFADLPNTTTGATNQGEGIYSFDCDATDNANNTGWLDHTEVVYDTTSPTLSIDTPSCTWRNSALNVTITAEDPISNGVNSGLAENNSYQYYLSNSATELSGGELKDYTSGTPISLNPEKSGTYYLFVKEIIDKAGNKATTVGTATTIDGTTYQMMGPYQFDYDNPTGGDVSASALYTNQPNVTVYVTGPSDAHSGVDYVNINGWYGTGWVSTHKEIRATYDSANNRYYATHTFAEMPNTSTGAINQGEGLYTIDAYVADRAGNASNPGRVQVIYDTTAPTISVDTQACTWRNTPLNVTITAQDPISNGSNSGIEASNLQYYLSNSATELSGGSWQNYTSGTPISLNPETSGTYYLFAKEIIDKAGNKATTVGTATTIDGTTYQMMGPYQFDYDKPTIGTLTMKVGSIDGKDYIHNTLTTENVYIYANDGLDALSGHLSTTYSINGGEAKASGKENATKLTKQGIYYITVTTTDIAGNTVTSNEYIVNINSVSPELTIGLDHGTIKPIYKPEWTKVGSKLNLASQTLTVTLKGSAYKSETIDENVNINYSSDVTSTLNSEDVQVFIDGVEVTSTTNPTVTVNAGTTETNGTTGKTEVTHTVQLTNLEEATRQAGVPYREWSGNVSLKIAGRGRGANTYTADVLTDEYGNQNMMETDENGTNDDGTWIDITFEDEEVNKNTDGVMFADFIKPEFSYKYSEADINYDTKTVKVVFSAIDKYFDNSSLQLEDLTILVDGEEPDWTKVTKEFIEITDVTDTVNGVEKVIGKQYTLQLSNLEQKPNDGFNYSGVVTVIMPAGKVTDTSGNTNNAQTITIGMSTEETTIEETEPYLPEGYSYVEGTSLEKGLVIQDSKGNQFVWIEVPRTAEVYQTAGLGIADFTEEEYTKIENDLHTYTSIYRKETSSKDKYSGNDASTGLTEEQYNNQKKKMLKSIYKNGGFYIGRYETGIENSYRTAKGEATQTPVIKQNAYPYNWVTATQAQTLSNSFSSDGYTSSLMFGVQWDLTLKYLETKGMSSTELNSNSTNIGNYRYTTFNITNASGKYSTNRGSTWSSTPYNKTETIELLVTTGTAEQFTYQNIGDISGNLWEFTLEYTSNTSKPVSFRGGAYKGYGSTRPASYRHQFETTYASDDVGFRVALYRDVWNIEDTSSGEETNDPVIVDVVDPIWAAENFNINHANQEVTIDLIAKDKYFESSNLTTNDITLYVDGIDMNNLGNLNKTLSAKTELFVDRDGDGTNETKYGEKYTLTITGWGEQTQEQTYVDWNGIRCITIGENTIIDQSGNTNKEQQIIIEEQNNAYTPRFTNRDETELNYTTDSKVDITYTLYSKMEETPYAEGDYRIISTKIKLQPGTRLTLKDYVQDKIYYCNITEETKYQVENGKYIYKLSNFIEMGSTDKHYIDSYTYYDSTAEYVLEKYNLSIDFLDANINADKLAQETYLELRSLTGAVKYNNGETTAKYNLRYDKNAIMSEKISNEGQTYTIEENTEIPFKLDASLIEQKTSDGKTIMDTKYYDKIEGIAIELLDENGKRLKEIQNFKLIDVENETESYEADMNGVIRIPIMQELSSISKNYKMTLSKNGVKTGKYSVNVYFFASDDGKHIGDETKVQKEFYVTVRNPEPGLLGIEATNESRIVNKETGLNLEGNSGIDMKIAVGDLTSQTNIRVELYKRDQTYTDPYDESSYTGTLYTLVDIKDYLAGTWQTPEECGLVSATDSKEYMLLPRQSYESLVEQVTIELKRAVKASVGTGEYKLVIKSYNDNSLVQTVKKTFIVVK